VPAKAYRHVTCVGRYQQLPQTGVGVSGGRGMRSWPISRRLLCNSIISWLNLKDNALGALDYLDAAVLRVS
jgi:hypothetical protein